LWINVNTIINTIKKTKYKTTQRLTNAITNKGFGGNASLVPAFKVFASGYRYKHANPYWS